jgi:16S rRNA (guanine527-N7)-methyltransferase
MLSNKYSKVLRDQGLNLTDEQTEALESYVGLLEEWNPRSRLVSKGDLEHLWDRHVVDSLSLAPILVKLGMSAARPHLLDIGSGGGFPAIPLMIALPQLKVTLVERKERKVGFLRLVCGKLGLGAVEILHGEFPQVQPSRPVDFVTARAVERPQRLVPKICSSLRRGATFLCQSGDPSALSPERFHVELVDDVLAQEGLRRGTLHLVRHSD